eukprot:6467555-Amphidinium_carterae.3
MQEAAPVEAQIGTQTVLLQSEWDHAVCMPQALTRAGGVCFCPKRLLPELVSRVGVTRAPTAVVVTEEPSIGPPSYTSADTSTSRCCTIDYAEGHLKLPSNQDL